MIGIIGGTGVYSIAETTLREQRQIATPYGPPSAPISFLSTGDQEFVFLARHGENHQLMPHEVNYRANIWALKSVGVRQLVGVSAVGSLREELVPGDFVIASQYVDLVKGNRDKTFFGEGLVAHVSTAEPTCPTLTAALADTANRLSMTLHRNRCYGCVDGPRLGTRAESHYLRTAVGCDLVGMTNVPEVFLAREAQICYCTVAIVTDYDCWLDDPARHVTVADVIARYGNSITRVNSLLRSFLAEPPPPVACQCRKALESAVLTPEDNLPEEKRRLLAMLSSS